MSALAFSRLASVSASTKRLPAISGGKRGAPATQIAVMRCTPLDPVDPDLRNRLEIDTPHELLQTFVDGGLDIKEGDVLVVDAVDYPIRSVANWTWRGSDFRHLIVEDLKT